ncbi:MAG: hypothetical protein LRY41_00305 [Candidatus Pacebacteria bacterium]|nr:hypothetical protein [Candidatus Paceibacterota bacterium]MCD8507961.1 hypothetical protein [Candidatus Paceibacterota bacterium]MCD8527777.1 hypothetical protein [Candidatus Paceibacterota bacterium]MCD8563785.1 hypothetical protein [Candidatus Paceibacterota bacterium]
MAKKNISFKLKQLTKKLLKELNDRSQYVITKRFGLHKGGDVLTLEAIGQEYGITRERVRQIEKMALKAIRSSSTFAEVEHIMHELKDIITSMGGIVEESHLLSSLSKDPEEQNHIHLYLHLGDHFEKLKEDKHYQARWVIKGETASRIEKALKDIHDALDHHELIPEDEIIDRILCHDGVCEVLTTNYQTSENAQGWLKISKKLDKNELGEWGRAASPNVRARGVKDYAYLVMRKHGSPMHFREVAEAIEKTFNRKTHTATCHNELIKDNRFVLVGRGVYALKEWGYKGGVVRDVIREIIEKEGPLSKEEIVDHVLKERYLKKNTILVNLQNSKYFVKDDNGLYRLA